MHMSKTRNGQIVTYRRVDFLVKKLPRQAP